MDDAQGYQEGDGHDLVLLKQEWIKYALVPFHHLFVVISLVCQEELTSYLLLVFGHTEHKTCSRVNLFLKMNLIGVYLWWSQVQMNMKGPNRDYLYY